MEEEKDRLALIIVDMQDDFVLPGAPAVIAGARDTVPKIKKALDAFRQKGQAVFHVTREYREDGSDIEKPRLQAFLKRKYAVPGTPGCAIVAALRPLTGEYRIVKKRFSAFMNTELDLMLRRLGIGHIVVCGAQYPTCIRATVFDAVAYGYSVTLLTDATSAQTEEIAAANIRDIRAVGVECVTVEEFLSRKICN